MDAGEDPLLAAQMEKENEGQMGPPLSSPQDQRLCRFYSQGRFCQYGKKCRFLHQRREVKQTLMGMDNRPEGEQGWEKGRSSVEEPTEETKQGTSVPESSVPVGFTPYSNPRPALAKRDTARPCRYFLSGYCAMEDRCRFWHPDQLPPVQDQQNAGERSSSSPKVPPAHHCAARQEVRLSELTTDLAKQLRDTEISQLLKRIPKDQLIVQEREDGQLTYYRIVVQPTDPDWPFDLKEVQIMINFPERYPQEVFTVVIPEDQDLPSVMGRHVSQASQEWLQAKHATNELMGKVELLFRPFLRWLDRNMERLFTEGARQLKKDIDAERSGIQFVSYHQLQAAICREQTPEMAAAHSGQSSSDGEEGEEGEGGEEAASPSEEVKASQPVEHVKTAEPRRGTEVKLLGLQLGEGTATVIARKITVSLQCSRCKLTADLVLTGTASCSAQCEKCSAEISAVFRPSMLHHYNDVLGYLDLGTAVPVDLVLQECELLVGCLSCSQENHLQNVSYGQIKEVNCQHCHSKLRVLADSTRFQHIQPRSRNQTGERDSMLYRPGRYPRDPAIQLGKPLPEKGACKHFKQSHRWLRFSCCGRAYPCDVCHDQDQDHPMELATRMICGYCAKEQPYNNGKPCMSCGGMMTRGAPTSHWEGGQGCRNKVKMSRNDRQKYANTVKTVSRKAKSEK